MAEATVDEAAPHNYESLTRLVVLIASSREPMTMLELEDAVPETLYPREKVSGEVRALEKQQLLSRLSKPARSNGPALYILTEGGKTASRRILLQEVKDGFPTAKMAFAAALLQSLPKLKDQVSLKEAIQIATEHPAELLAALNARPGRTTP
jgi:hypothetical protein